MTVMHNALVRGQAAPSPPIAFLPDGGAVCFGPFRLSLARHALFEGDKLVRLGSRALDLLVALVERHGEVVGKDELMARVWPDTFVEEGNLRVHLAGLRKVLGDARDGARYIVNSPGRGYSFVAPISVATDAAPSTVTQEPRGHRSFASPHTRMVGRDETVRSIVAQLPSRRFITLVGPGGIGKTTVALAVADAFAGSYRDGIHFIDLASLADQRLVQNTVASALGLAVAGDTTPGLATFLGDREMLLVVDNCEHVIEAAAALAERISRETPRVHILATSREPLRAAGERVFRLGPLELPPEAGTLTAGEALRSPAVQLFVELAAASDDAFKLTDADAPIVAEICRRLDGVALAIELAAGRVDVFGVRGLAERLDDRFRVLTHGRRTALPRQKTLAATLDWSFQLLSDPERTVLTRLSVFAGAMTMESAAAVVASDAIDDADVIEAIANLVAKSLVSVDVGGRAMRYRLLDTTRAYAIEKLMASGDFAATRRRHAEFCLVRCQQAASEATTPPTAEWLDEYARDFDDLRGALGWAFSPDGDGALAMALSVAAAPFGTSPSMLEECRRSRGTRALRLTPSPEVTPRPLKRPGALGNPALPSQVWAAPAGESLR